VPSRDALVDLRAEYGPVQLTEPASFGLPSPTLLSKHYSWRKSASEDPEARASRNQIPNKRSGRVGDPTSPAAELARKLLALSATGTKASPTANSSSSSTTSWLNMDYVGDRENHCHAKGSFLVCHPVSDQDRKARRPCIPVYRSPSTRRYQAAGGEQRAARWRASPDDLSIDWQPASEADPGARPQLE